MNKEEHALFFISPVSERQAILTKEEYRHACSVLRVGSDSAVQGTDGRGNLYKCKLGARSRERGEVDIVETVAHAPLAPAALLYIGLPEKEVFEEALTGLAALGAAKIVPLVCCHCQKPWWNEWGKRLERLQRKMIAGIKQAHNPWLPELHAPQPFSEALDMLGRETGEQTARLVADPGGTAVEEALRGNNAAGRIDCFIGPPGGFSPKELERLSAERFRLVKIAPYRLRTELAAIVLCAEIMQHGIGGGPADLPNVK
jgi:16S rRNA (uracil1498-N3)-methyltransferase